MSHHAANLRDAIEAARARGRTQRQLALDFIVAYQREYGWAPTVREVADALEVNVSTAHTHLRGLVHEGRIVRGEGPRMIRITNGSIEVAG